ncbi:DUF1801 domain-containing protein [Pseudactinotalea suaedae]|uniref:DUF1801 domain-containing protein n=1 Tax=Pseudactinotalea suaedae TaxID=1524924 RepID=UPI0012E1FF96|nr:DUF1801 domain-containing protein [Pseudactinotalea suaedae]
MAEAKTRPTEVPVSQFLDAVTPAARREDGVALAALMAEVTGVEPVMWGPSIVGYGTFRYRSSANPRTQGEIPRVGFAARKNALVLYGLKDSPEAQPLLASLGTYTEGAGCVYVKRLGDVDEGVLRQLVGLAFARVDEA